MDCGPCRCLLLLVPTVFWASLWKNGRVLLGMTGRPVGVLTPRFRVTKDPIAPLLSERQDLIIKWFLIRR